MPGTTLVPRRSLLPCACVAAAVALATPVSANARQDGSWAIEVMTERGACDQLYRYYVVIAGQAVHLRSPFGETSPEPVGALR